ncbi:KdsC family phosphatase [Parapedobacter sp.]
MVLFDRFKQVKAFLFAVDGVCTDGGIWMADGERLYGRIHSRDYYALRVATAHGYPIAIVGEREGTGMMGFMKEIGINDVFLNESDKSTVLRDWMAVKGLAGAQVLYMGSDIPDLRPMEIAGFGACPIDAVEDVKEVATYVSHCRGGGGAVRDVVEKVMKLHGTWDVMGSTPKMRLT